MNKNIDFVNGNTKKCLLEMTVPMIIAMFLNMAYNLVDSLWIGNLLGEQAYAALTNSTPIILILTSIGMGATNGLAILLSQVIGAKNEQKKKNIIVTSFFVSIILSVFMTIVLEIFCKRSIASTLKKLRTAVIGGSWLLLFSNPFWKFFRPW